jgi:hypothetical protein
MSLKIILAKNFEPSTVKFSDIKKNKNGGKAVYINSSELIQLPYMRSPFGLSAFTDESTNRTTYSLDLSFDQDNEEASELCKKLSELDDKIVETVAANSVEWLGKEYSVAVLKEALYKPMVRPGKEPYPATLKLKVMTNPNGEFVPEVYNPAKEMIPVDSIDKGSRVMCIVDINQIWFIDNKFGVSVRLKQALCQQTTKLKSFAFQGLDNAPEDIDENEDDIEIDE